MVCACTGGEACSIRATGSTQSHRTRHTVLVGPAWGSTAAVVVKSVPELPREQCGQAASATADTRAPALWPQGHQMAAWWRRTSTGPVRPGEIRLLQLLSSGAKPSTSLQWPQPGTVAGLGKVAGGREEQSCSCCSPQLSNKLHVLEISVRMTGTEKKTSRNGQFSKGESHCNYTSCENIIPSWLSSAVLYFLRINLQRALACLSLHCSGATR